MEKSLTLIISTAILIVSCTPNNSKSADKLSPEQACIQNVLMLDDSIGAVRNHACETISIAETIRDYVAGMQSADFSNCPDVFKNAFEDHRQAWLNMIPLVEKYPTMRGEMHDLFDELEKGEDATEFEPLLKAIWDTWAEVEKAKEEKGLN